MSKSESTSLRQSKREQLRAERRRTSIIWNVIVLGSIAIVVLAIAGYTLANARPGPLPGEQLIPDEGNGTVSATSGLALTFNHYPPSSGTHYNDQVADWGAQTTPIEEGVYLRNLEHGGVVFLYNCPTACPELEAQFQALFKKATPDKTYNRVKIVAAPYAGDLSSQIVALAWNYQLDLAKFDEATLLRWYQRFVNHGPNNAP